MYTLQHKLRQLRGWQRKTLKQVANGQRIDLLTRLEQGDAKVLRAQMNPIENETTKEWVSKAYGLRQDTFKKWLEDEYDWRLNAGSCAGKGQGLPRLTRYVYRDLPEAAHNLFCDGFVCLDLETTGKDPHQDTEVCEITVLDTDGVPLLSSFVKPSKPIPAEVTALHGITDEMVADAPTFREIYSEIAFAITGQTVVIYNANYDAYLLDRLFIENDLDMPPFEQWCLMLAYARHHRAPGKYLGQYAWQSLSAACEQQGVEQDGEAHRTLADTLSTWRLLQKLALQYKA